MSKKYLIQLADAIRFAPGAFSPEAVNRLADFCAKANPNFDRQRWLDYIAGGCGPGGGKRGDK